LRGLKAALIPSAEGGVCISGSRGEDGRPSLVRKPTTAALFMKRNRMTLIHSILLKVLLPNRKEGFPRFKSQPCFFQSCHREKERSIATTVQQKARRTNWCTGKNQKTSVKDQVTLCADTQGSRSLINWRGESASG